MNVRRLLLAKVLILCALTAGAPAELLPGAQERMLEELKYLASDELEGRGVDTEGIDLAAEHIRQAFTQAGLEVSWGQEGYQPFEMVVGTELREPNTLVFVGPDGEQHSLALEEDFRTMSFGTAGEFTAPIVFCGYGISAEDLEYDSFAGLDLEGKVAVIVRRTPQQGDEEGLFNSGHHGTFMKHAALSSKIDNAKKHGAVAVLFVNDPYSGRSELAKLEEQWAKAEQNVIAAAEGLVAGGAAKETAKPQAAKDRAEDEQSRDGQAENVPGANPHGRNPHAAIPNAVNPHGANPHGGHAPLTPSGELTQAVRHLRQVRQLIEEYDADPLMEFGYGGRARGESVPVMHVAQQSIDRLLQASLGKSLEQIEAEIDQTGKPQSTPLEGWQAVGQTSLEVVRREVKNVIGVLPGKGPRAEETIVVGAHYDHVGRGGEGSMSPGSNEIHNGADDNASGTVALMELARMLAAREEPLPRRVVFIAFTAEERGLLGSAHYVKEPLIPLEKTVAMFNMDMVGRLTDDKLTVFGTGTAPRWDDWIDREAAERDFVISKKLEGLGPSDHSSFYAKKIPVLHFFTGTHNDYHRPSDDWEKINIEGMARIVDLLEELVVTTAQTEEPPQYVAVQGKASLEPRTGARPYFGSIPDFGTEAKGYAIQGVSPDSPADKAGVKAGDVLIKLGEHQITGLDDFDLALRTFSAGEAVEMVVLRDGNEVTLTVTLATPRQ
jgi:hypothetical protein